MIEELVNEFSIFQRKSNVNKSTEGTLGERGVGGRKEVYSECCGFDKKNVRRKGGGVVKTNYM